MFFTVLLCGFGSAQVLIQPLSGEIQYQYQYQDYTSAGFHSSTSAQNPVLNLGTSGSVLNPGIFSFNVSSFLNLTSSSTSAPEYTALNKQLAWDYYNLDLTILRDLPITASMLLNDGFTQTSSSAQQIEQGGTRLRRQTQNLRLMVRRITYLPSMSFSVNRSHQWSLSSESPVDYLNTNYSANLSSGGQGGSLSLSGSMIENLDRHSGYASRYYSLVFRGVRNFADLQSLDFDIDYNRFSDVTNVRETASYMNTSDKQLHYTATLSSYSNSTLSFQSNQANLSQSLQYIQNEHLRYSLGLNGSYGHTESVAGSSFSTDNALGSVSFAIQHSRGYGRLSTSNGINFGYGVSKYIDREATVNAGFSNSLTTYVGSYQLSAGHSLSYGQSRNNQSRSSVSNNANVDISGTPLYNFQTQVNTSYLSEVYVGDLETGLGNNREIRLQWMIYSPTFLSRYFQFSVELSGSEDWLFRDFVQRTSVWTACLKCSQSYIPNLSFTYRYNRSYVPYYCQQSVTHSLELHYRWRAVAMELRYEHYTLIDTRSNLWFTLSRPF